jgi:hypothetical protein
MALSAPAAASDAPAAGPTALPDGSYRLEMAVFTRADVPVLGDVDSISRQLMVVTLERGDEGLIQTQHMCDIRMETTSRLGRPYIPRAFIDAIPDRSYPVTLSGEGELEYRAVVAPHRAGWDPALSDGMPEDPEHPSVRDEDRDRQPGVTIQLHVPLLGQVDLYVVQDVHTILEGTVVSQGRVEGQIDFYKLEQRALGASNPLFRSTPRAVPDRSKSPFTLTRISDGATCAEISW